MIIYVKSLHHFETEFLCLFVNILQFVLFFFINIPLFSQVVCSLVAHFSSKSSAQMRLESISIVILVAIVVVVVSIAIDVLWLVSFWMMSVSNFLDNCVESIVIVGGV